MASSQEEENSEIKPIKLHLKMTLCHILLLWMGWVNLFFNVLFHYGGVAILFWIDFNSISIHLGLFYAKGLGDHVHCISVVTFLSSFLSFLCTFIGYQVFLSNANNFQKDLFHL